MNRKGRTHSKIGFRWVPFGFCAKAMTLCALLAMQANMLILRSVLVSCALFIVCENNLFLLLQAEGKSTLYLWRQFIFVYINVLNNRNAYCWRKDGDFSV
jgi:hypothetical protein